MMTYWDDKAINPPQYYENLDNIEQSIKSIAWLVSNHEWKVTNDEVLEVLLKALAMLESEKLAYEKEI